MKRLLIYWEFDRAWYYADVLGFDPVSKMFRIKYGDDDQENLDLSNETFILQATLRRSEIVPLIDVPEPYSGTSSRRQN